MKTGMKILFLDANILFSVAYRENSKLGLLWTLEKTELMTSFYALEEARRNLKLPDQHARLEFYATQLKIVSHDLLVLLPQDLILKDKDRPILSAAIQVKADFLLTGDFQDFGRYFGTVIQGVMILPPAEFLKNFST